MSQAFSHATDYLERQLSVEIGLALKSRKSAEFNVFVNYSGAMTFLLSGDLFSFEKRHGEHVWR